jgi:hypothetical protein
VNHDGSIIHLLKSFLSCLGLIDPYSQVARHSHVYQAVLLETPFWALLSGIRLQLRTILKRFRGLVRLVGVSAGAFSGREQRIGIRG